MWQGLYEDTLKLFDSQSNLPSSNWSRIEILAIEGVANASLHRFSEAEKKLLLAAQLCQVNSELTCGDVLRARGVLAVQLGQIEIAKGFFWDSLQFARTHKDPFLEETALLNLGLTSLRDEHFDEAIDWTDAAYKAATNLGANGEAQAALGNLGWAYYNLGDFERSLDFSLEAEKRSILAGETIDQLYWMTNVGYVYAKIGDFARAKASYLKALDLATRIKGREGIYNALRALALVCVERGEVEEARKYSEEALKIARADNNRLNELYPLLVEGLVATSVGDEENAELWLREVEQDQSGNGSLKWRAEHGLALLYDKKNRPGDADSEYRIALATFEHARSSLQRNDSKLPFSGNAAPIYDDYIHFLVAQGKPERALRWADYNRARTLSEGLGLLSDAHAKGKSRQDHADAPLLDARAIARRAGGTLLFYWLGEKQSYLWAITSKKIRLFTLPPRSDIEAAARHYRIMITGPQDALQSGEEGRALYRMLVAPAQPLLGKDAKVFIVPDGSLNGLNFETLVVPTANPHFWIEDVNVVNSSSLRVLAASLAGRKTKSRRLLLLGDSVSAGRDYPELPKAAEQMTSVARHFPAAQQSVYRRDLATPAAYLRNHPEQYSFIHFVAHGTSSRLSPLDSAIVLSKEAGDPDSFKLYARDIIQHRLHADLVTISACYGSGEREYSGEGLVGLAWAFLRAGSRDVIAALWEVTDASTDQLMDRFYEELTNGAAPEVALRRAKLALLRGTAFHDPFYWAPFQLYEG